MDYFFVGRAEGGEGAGEAGLAGDDEIIGTKAEAAGGWAGDKRFTGYWRTHGRDARATFLPIQPVFEAAWFFKRLENVQIGRREGDRLVEAVLPFLARAIAAENHAAGAPCGLVVTRNLDDEITFFLRGIGQIAPLAQRAAGGVGRIKDRSRRQRRGVHDPRGRDQSAEEFERAAAERLSPVIGEQVMVEERGKAEGVTV